MDDRGLLGPCLVEGCQDAKTYPIRVSQGIRYPICATHVAMWAASAPYLALKARNHNVEWGEAGAALLKWARTEARLHLAPSEA
jgi:hypothetical protein